MDCEFNNEKLIRDTENEDELWQSLVGTNVLKRLMWDSVKLKNEKNAMFAKQTKALRKMLPDMNAVTADTAAKAKESVEKLNNAIDDAVQRLKVAKPNKNARPAFDEDEMVPVPSFREDEIAFQAYRKFCNDVEGLKEEGARVLKQIGNLAGNQAEQARIQGN